MTERVAAPKISLAGFPVLGSENGFVFDELFWDHEAPVALTSFAVLVWENGFVFGVELLWDNEAPLALMSFAIASIVAWSCSSDSRARFSSSDNES